MREADRSPLTDDQVAEILSRPNGPYALIELSIMGRIDAEDAVTAIEAARPEPLLYRLARALADTLFERSEVPDL